MFGNALRRRKLVSLAASALLAGCAVIPKAERPTPAPPPLKATTPSEALPQDIERHRVALLVPLTGANAGVGQSLANAATMALLDTNAKDLRVTTYDTGLGAAAAAARAVADGNGLILGPLLADDIPGVAGAAKPAGVPVIAFSNDAAAANRGVLVMGSLPGQSVARTLRYATGQGLHSFAALVPRGTYGDRASTAMLSATRSMGASVVAMEGYDRSAASAAAAARRLQAKGGYDAVVVLDGGRIAAQVAPLLKTGTAPPRIMGTELWSGESTVAAAPGLRGAWYAALPDARFRQFSASYRTRFGAQPYRIATMGYDAVLLVLRIARDWHGEAPFPTAKLYDAGGFLGLDGPFRFGRDGVIERAFEVREVRAGTVAVVSPAPAGFGG